jgi:UDP-N-acetylmuramate--alanine ligase
MTSFAIRQNARFRAVNIAEYRPGFFEFDVMLLDDLFAHLRLGVPGYHNIYNALAMCCCVPALGLKPEDAVRAAEQFHGAGRRFEIKGECNGAVIVDDYAHHPTELDATLKTAREMGYKRLIAVHQPFTYSRTKTLMDDFATVLKQADLTVLLPIMGSREVDDGSVKSEDLAAKIPGSIVVNGLDAAASWVKANAREGDLVVCMSCGDLYKAADKMVGKA